jgi:2-keto-4-pentenoate hydratase/2-oxohepta-3-ene-1,7-dioic acid hydratase in catechol pathway
VRLASFDDCRIGAVVGDDIVDITDLAPSPGGTWPPLDMVRFIARHVDDLADVTKAVEDRPRVPLGKVRLGVPVPWPSKVLAFPANYVDHIAEMKSSNRATINGFFLKAPSSLTGPQGPIIIPDLPGASVHHEAELAIVVGRGGRGVTRNDALDHIFGYACLLDITVRGKQERVMRKSFDTFTPLGPWIVTADEVPNPDELDVELRVNGEIRQAANTRDLILDVRGMIEMVASVATLETGDIIATGTPAGVGPIVPGDLIEMTISGVGSMSVPVVAGGPIQNQAFDE